MTRRASLLGAGLFFSGLVVGVYIQHRWPAGRWHEDKGPAPKTAPLSLEQLAKLPGDRRLVIIIAGQSNAANYGSVRSVGGPGVYAYHSGVLYQAADPLPGADGHGGSPWPRLGASLILRGNYEAVVFATLAQGSSTVADWAPGGRLHNRLIETLHSLKMNGLAADFILWQQGESEGWSPETSGASYLDSLKKLIEATRAVVPQTRWVIARATFGASIPGNAQIREAQHLASTIPGAFAGPDLDLLETGYRHDGVHFNRAGLDMAASLWLDALDPLLPRKRTP